MNDNESVDLSEQANTLRTIATQLDDANVSWDPSWDEPTPESSLARYDVPIAVGLFGFAGLAIILMFNMMVHIANPGYTKVQQDMFSGELKTLVGPERYFGYSKTVLTLRQEYAIPLKSQVRFRDATSGSVVLTARIQTSNNVKNIYLNYATEDIFKERLEQVLTQSLLTAGSKLTAGELIEGQPMVIKKMTEIMQTFFKEYFPEVELTTVYFESFDFAKPTSSKVDTASLDAPDWMTSEQKLEYMQLMQMVKELSEMRIPPRI